MLKTVSELAGSQIHATDDDVGKIEEVYFDDQAWAIRYLVVQAGSWLSGREVLISPYSVTPPLGNSKRIQVTLTRQQIELSPSIDTHKPVSRQHERDVLGYYAYPEYWAGGEMWAMNSLPLLPPAVLNEPQAQAERERLAAEVLPEDVHLRSSSVVGSYDIQASDGSIGHVKDFIFDDESWAIRYLLVDTRNWWPGGKKVLIATQWIDHIDWAEKTVFVKLSRQQIQDSPAYDEATTIGRDYEQRLHDAYGREGYWI